VFHFFLPRRFARDGKRMTRSVANGSGIRRSTE
jgi:hypothetical protein